MLDSAADSAGFVAKFGQYKDWLKTRGYASDTIVTVEVRLRTFSLWCEERGIFRPSEVTRPIVERFQRHLFYTINSRTKRPLGISTQLTLLANLRSYFKWLVRQGYVLHNPTSDLDLPRREKTLPKHVLTAHEADRVMNVPDIHTPLGLRDRSILETAYSSALRRSEIRNLKIDDVDLEREIIFVRKGKGRKDRVVPIGERACRWIRAYLFEARRHLACPPDEGVLFLSNRGGLISKHQLSYLATQYIQKSGVGKKGSCHLFRHTCATVMLEGGADIRYIQAMLGHAKLDTTQIYTHVAITKLKEIHSVTHPGAKLNPCKDKDTKCDHN